MKVKTVTLDKEAAEMMTRAMVAHGHEAGTPEEVARSLVADYVSEGLAKEQAAIEAARRKKEAQAQKEEHEQARAARLATKNNRPTERRLLVNKFLLYELLPALVIRKQTFPAWVAATMGQDLSDPDIFHAPPVPRLREVVEEVGFPISTNQLSRCKAYNKSHTAGHIASKLITATAKRTIVEAKASHPEEFQQIRTLHYALRGAAVEHQWKGGLPGCSAAAEEEKYNTLVGKVAGLRIPKHTKNVERSSNHATDKEIREAAAARRLPPPPSKEQAAAIEQITAAAQLT